MYFDYCGWTPEIWNFFLLFLFYSSVSLGLSWRLHVISRKKRMNLIMDITMYKTILEAPPLSNDATDIVTESIHVTSIPSHL